MSYDRAAMPFSLLRRSPIAAALVAGCLLSAPAWLPLPHAEPARAADDRLSDEEPVPPKVQAAVDKALGWLKNNQKPDGTWPGAQNNSTAVPSLAVMAMLSRGHVPGQGPYGEIINRSIDYVLSVQQEDGYLTNQKFGNSSMYEHGISSAMLSEAYGMVDDTRKAKIERAMAKSAQLILEAQRVKKPEKDAGGWRYTKTSADSDISVTGWQLMALRGAANCGATVPKEALVAGREYVRRCAVQGAEGGFAYQPGQGPNAPRTGTAILSLEMLGEHASKEALAGGEYLLKHIPDNVQSEFYYYAVYYCSQAMYQLGGKFWETGYPKLRDALLAQQGEDGTWASGNGQEDQAGPAYRTSMAVLALCVPYKYLPLYQK